MTVHIRSVTCIFYCPWENIPIAITLMLFGFEDTTSSISGRSSDSDDPKDKLSISVNTS